MEAKEIKGLMEAYASIYSPQVIDESECECEEDEKEEDEKSMEMKGKKKNKKKELANEDLQQKVGQALDAAAKNPVIKAIGKVIAPVGKGRGTVTKAEQERKIKEEVDLFDYLLEYLVAEGYADTNKAALAIMANMSEEWKQDIVEAYLEVHQDLTEFWKGRHGQTETEYMDSRSDAGKRISGDAQTGPRYYTLGRSRGVRPDAPTKPGAKPQNTPKLADWEKKDINYRKANLNAIRTRSPFRLSGGSSSLPNLGSSGGSELSPAGLGKFTPGSGRKFGISGIGLADEYNLDIFDVILEHLVAEGYADTNKAALAIMANMSEEWKQDIVEAKYGTKAGRKALAKKIRKGEEIGKSGPGTGFKAVEKAAKEGGARDPQAVAAAAMWKAHGGKKG